MLAGPHQLDDQDALRLLRCTPGLAQETRNADRNLGYGQLYYALGRLLRPRVVLVVGSGFGFAPGAFALALTHNGGPGRVLFVDPGYDGAREGPERAHGGTGVWRRPGAVRARFTCLGVEDRVTHFAERNDQFFPKVTQRNLPPPELVLIDGAHDTQNAVYDVSQALAWMRVPGYLLLHDSTNWFNRAGYMGVASVVEALRRDTRAEVLTVPGQAGLTLVRIRSRASLSDVRSTPPAPVLLGGFLLLTAGFFLGRWIR